MKQQITEDQLKELPEDQYKKLAMWCRRKGASEPNTYPYEPHLNIGQMIEFLYDHRDREHELTRESLSLPTFLEDHIEPEKFCDDLWEQIKYKLE